MKTCLKLKPRLTRVGSILVVTLLLSAILVLTLGGYCGGCARKIFW